MSDDYFFTSEEFAPTKVSLPLRPQCDDCGLLRQCKSPKMQVDGEGRRGILVVGERPGRDEDRQGKPFVGPTGELLRDAFGKFGVDLRRDCWLTNAIVCAPQNATPDRAVEDCRPNIVKAITDLKPKVILLVGTDAVKSVIGWLWKPSVGGIERWVGWQIPDQKLNAWVCPTYQPALLFYSTDPVHKMDFERHVGNCCDLTERPWPKGPPDYSKQVEVIFSPREAAVRLGELGPGSIVFDFETNCLKPDSAQGRIVSASVCWNGKVTLSFPWEGPVVPAMKKLLRDPKLKKGAWNFKMEDRWVRAKMGIEVEGWDWDGMLAAHAMDPRGSKDGDKRKGESGVTGLKFQSYVRLGMADYSGHVEAYLHSSEKSGYSLNRITELDLGKLLLYGGLDSLGAWKIIRLQKQIVYEYG